MLDGHENTPREEIQLMALFAAVERAGTFIRWKEGVHHDSKHEMLAIQRGHSESIGLCTLGENSIIFQFSEKHIQLDLAQIWHPGHLKFRKTSFV